MDTQYVSKTNWLAVVILTSGMAITLIILGIILVMVSETCAVMWAAIEIAVEKAVFFGASYLALPSGLLCLIAGTFARTKNRKVALTGIIVGVLGILTGLLFWGWVFLVSSVLQ